MRASARSKRSWGKCAAADIHRSKTRLPVLIEGPRMFTAGCPGFLLLPLFPKNSRCCSASCPCSPGAGWTGDCSWNCAKIPFGRRSCGRCSCVSATCTWSMSEKPFPCILSQRTWPRTNCSRIRTTAETLSDARSPIMSSTQNRTGITGCWGRFRACSCAFITDSDSRKRKER